MRSLSTLPVEAASRSAAEASVAPLNGNDLVQYWRGVISRSGKGDGGDFKRDPVVQLLRAAIEDQGRSMPEAPLQLLMEVYKCGFPKTTHKRLFFQLISQEFGVDAGAVESAVERWHTAAAHTREAADEADVQSRNRALMRAADRLNKASTPQFKHLFTSLSQLPGGMDCLVQMRGDLITLIRQQPAGSASLQQFSEHLRQNLAEWFSVGNLSLDRISWDSPASMLSKLMATDAVHAITSWEDLKSRLAPDRRVFAFYHNALPQVPLVVLHTALTHARASSMRDILPNGRYNYLHEGLTADLAASGRGEQGEAQYLSTVYPDTWREYRDKYGTGAHRKSDLYDDSVTDPAFSLWSQQSEAAQDALGSSVPLATGLETPPTTAVFYSVSTTLPGLAGVELGNFLIKQVAQRIQTEFPTVDSLVTLSPVRNFRRWLRSKMAQEIHQVTLGDPNIDPLLSKREVARLTRAMPHLLTRDLGCDNWVTLGINEETCEGVDDTLREQVLVQLHEWLEDLDRFRGILHSHSDVFRPVLMRLCARYLTQERRRNLCLDPVAHFHSRNGAELERIIWMADTSKAGLTRGCCIMVNYRYDLSRVQANNRRYLVDHEMTVSPGVLDLIQPSLTSHTQ